MSLLVASETTSFSAEVISLVGGQLGNGIQLHRSGATWGSIVGSGSESTTLGGGFEGDGIHSFYHGLCSCKVCWLLHSHKGSEVVFEASEVVVHVSGWIHVRKFQHD